MSDYFKSKTIKIPEDRQLTLETKAKIRDFSVTLLEFLQLYRYTVLFSNEDAIDGLLKPYIKLLKPDQKIPTLRGILRELSLEDNPFEELTLDQITYIIEKYQKEPTLEYSNDYNSKEEFDMEKMKQKLRIEQEQKIALESINLLRDMFPEMNIFKDYDPSETFTPGTHYFDFVTPNESALDASRKKLLEPLIEGIENLYINLPEKPIEPSQGDIDQSNYYFELTNKMGDWMTTYAIEMGFPLERSEEFFEIAKLAASVYRQLDIVRDWGYIQTMMRAKNILEDHKTPHERLEWFKGHHQKILEMTDQMRALMGKDGETYLEHNEMVIQWNIKNKLADMEGTEVVRLKPAFLEGNTGEMDNPEERAIVQLISMMLKSSMDHIEVAKLNEVTSFSDLYSFYIWKFTRMKAQEQSLRALDPEELKKEFKENEEDAEEDEEDDFSTPDENQEDQNQDDQNDNENDQNTDEKEDSGNAPGTEEASHPEESNDQVKNEENVEGEKENIKKENVTEGDKETPSAETKETKTESSQTKAENEENQGNASSPKEDGEATTKKDEKKTQKSDASKETESKDSKSANKPEEVEETIDIIGPLKYDDPNFKILNKVLPLYDLEPITAKSYDDALNSLGFTRAGRVFDSIEDLDDQKALEEIYSAYKVVEEIAKRHHAKDEEKFDEAKAKLSEVIEKHSNTIQRLSADSPEDADKLQRIIGFLESNKTPETYDIEEMLKSPPSSTQDDFFRHGKINSEDLADLMGLLASGRPDRAEALKVVLKSLMRQFNIKMDDIPSAIDKTSDAEVLTYLIGLDKPGDNDYEILYNVFNILKQFPDFIEHIRERDAEAGKLLDIFNAFGESILKGEDDSVEEIPFHYAEVLHEIDQDAVNRKFDIARTNAIRKMYAEDPKAQTMIDAMEFYRRVLNRIKKLHQIDPDTKIDIDHVIKIQKSIDNLKIDLKNSKVVEYPQDEVSPLNPEWQEILRTYEAPSIFDEPLRHEHYIDKREFINQLFLIKFLKLRKLGYELGIYQTQPLFESYTLLLRTLYSQMLDIHFWHKVPHKFAHRKVFEKLRISHLLTSHKLYRELMLLINPLLWSSKHYIPKDSSGDVYKGQTLLELSMQNLTKFHVPGGEENQRSGRTIQADEVELPPEAYHTIFYENKVASESERNLFKNLLLILALAGFSLYSIKEMYYWVRGAAINMDPVIRLTGFPSYALVPIHYVDMGIRVIDYTLIQYVRFLINIVKSLFKDDLHYDQEENLVKRAKAFAQMDEKFEEDSAKGMTLKEIEKLDIEGKRGRGMARRTDEEDLMIYERQKKNFAEHPERFYQEEYDKFKEPEESEALVKASILIRKHMGHTSKDLALSVITGEWREHYKSFLRARNLDEALGESLEEGYTFDDLQDIVAMHSDTNREMSKDHILRERQRQEMENERLKRDLLIQKADQKAQQNRQSFRDLKQRLQEERDAELRDSVRRESEDN